MNKHFFVLGNTPLLSSSEILRVFEKNHILYKIILLTSEVLVISSDSEINHKDIMSVLGGTIKSGIILNEMSYEEGSDKFENIFSASNLTEKYLENTERKVHLGISVYDGGADKGLIFNLSKNIAEFLFTAKDNLKREGVNAGFVRVKERKLSSVSVAKNGLIDKGAEIVIIMGENQMFAGRTETVQDFESFTTRDYYRPIKDKRSGIIPPKLARMMINISLLGKGQFLYDPFCGSGTILTEAISMGHKNIRGSDISQKAIDITKSNISWLFNRFRNLNKSSYNISVEKRDAVHLSKFFPNSNIDVIVTEPYLGPPITYNPSKQKITETIKMLEDLYIRSFSEFSKIMKDGGRIVIVFPVFKANNKDVYIEILGEIERLGFKKEVYYPEDNNISEHGNLSVRKTIIFGYPDQFVRREILVWRKN